MNSAVQSVASPPWLVRSLQELASYATETAENNWDFNRILLENGIRSYWENKQKKSHSPRISSVWVGNLKHLISWIRRAEVYHRLRIQRLPVQTARPISGLQEVLLNSGSAREDREMIMTIPDSSQLTHSNPEIARESHLILNQLLICFKYCRS